MKALQGFSLIEQLVTCTLSILALGFLSYFFTQTSANAKLWQEKQQLLYNAHTVTLLFLPLLQQAGIHGCRHLESENLVNLVGESDYDLNKPVQIFHSQLYQDSLGIVSLGLGEHVLNIRENTVLVAGDTHLKPRDIILISNCMKGEVHLILDIQEENGNKKLFLQNEVLQPFLNNMQIYPVYHDLFFVRKHALYRIRKSKPAQELISNINSMHIDNTHESYFYLDWVFSKKFIWSLIIKRAYV